MSVSRGGRTIQKVKKISNNIEYSMSKGRRQFLLLAGIFCVGILILFMTASWLSISTTRAEFGAAPVGAVPNYYDFTPENVVYVIQYWQSPSYSYMDKIEFTLNAGLLLYGSYSPEFNSVTGAFQITIGQLVSVISMSILLGVYTNLWLLARKSGCRIGKAAKGTGGIAGTGGGASGIFSMLLLAGCCGGTGVSFLLFSLPVIGSVFSGFYASFDTLSVLLITIPSNALLIGLIAFMASKQITLATEEQKTTKRAVGNWLTIALYLIVPAIFLTTFALAMYWWNFQSIAVLKSGMTGGQQNTTIALYATLPISASLLLMAGLIQLRRMLHKPKPEMKVSA
ncbi:MAG: hypothetical protein V3T40_03040 [Nitrososphaerales archaeon]